MHQLRVAAVCLAVVHRLTPPRAPTAIVLLAILRPHACLSRTVALTWVRVRVRVRVRVWVWVRVRVRVRVTAGLGGRVD